MNKITASLLILFVLFSLAACSDETVNTSSDDFSKTVSEEEKSEEPEVSDESDDISKTESDDEQDTMPEYISNFVSFAPIATTLRATDNTSIRLTAINKSADYGDVVLYTKDFGSKIHAKNGDYEEYAVMVCEYDHTYFGYVKKDVYGIDDTETEKADIVIPDDGFVIVAHSTQDKIIGKFSELNNENKLFVHGVQIADLGFEISETEIPIEIDGILENSWNAFQIDKIDENNQFWEYYSFEKDNYYSTAEYYMTFDKDYLYLAVVVNSPYHYCPITPATANSMWQYECIQVKVADQSPLSEYMSEHYDHIIDKDAVNNGHVRSYGFAVSDDGETCYYESGINTEFSGLAGVKRDDGAQTTTYEAAIPWAEFDIDISEKEQIGVTFSINSTNQEDIDTGNWRNLILRDGGGVIGRNDWSKIPVVTLNHK